MIAQLLHEVKAAGSNGKVCLTPPGCAVTISFPATFKEKGH